MILNIVALLFVAGITFMHSMFGLYSGIINVACSIVALAISFGFFEVVNGLLTTQAGLHPAYTEPVTLALLFAISLGLLRLVADQFIRGNVRVPMYVDWGGGAVCGFINAQICVGVMVLAFLMVPFGGKVAGYQRYARDVDNETYRTASVPSELRKQDDRIAFVRNKLWLRSDDFTVWLAKTLSGGSLSGSTSLAAVYPDFAEWVWWSGNTVQHESMPVPQRNDTDGFERGLRVETAWTQVTDLEARYRENVATEDQPTPPYVPLTYQIQPGHELLGTRLVLDNSSADRTKTGAPYHRFRPTMFRLVGDVGDEPRHFVAQLIGGADERIGPNYRIVEADENFSLEAQGETRIDVIFEIPAGFEPRFVEYKRHARVALTPANIESTPPETRLSLGGGETSAAVASAGGTGTATGQGLTRFIETVDHSFTGGIDRLPFEMASATLRSEQVDIVGSKLGPGRVTKERDALEQGTGTKIATFDVPSGQKIFQIQTRARQAASLAGQVFNFVGSVANQYYALSNTGEQYPLCGYYAIVERNGQQFIELVYAPDDPAFRGMLDFQTDGIRNLLRDQDDAKLGLLFLVPPGTCITSIRTSSRGSIDFGQEFCVGS